MSTQIEINKRQSFIDFCIEDKYMKHFFTVILLNSDFWIRAEKYVASRERIYSPSLPLNIRCECEMNKAA